MISPAVTLDLNGTRCELRLEFDDQVVRRVLLGPDGVSPRLGAVLTQALVNNLSTLSEPAVAAHVRAALPFGESLGGLTPFDLASAVRTALHPVGVTETIGRLTVGRVRELTAPLTELRWRVIPETPLPAETHLALDEVISARVGPGKSPPTLRFWGWEEECVVLGRTQSVSHEVHRQALDSGTPKVVRRISGGGTMFIEPAGAITYSLSLPEAAVARFSVRESYELLDAWAVQALRTLGYDAHHVPVNDIASGHGKIAGAAQARRRGAVLHHTTIAHALDQARMLSVLRLGQPRAGQRGTVSAQKQVAPLAGQRPLPRDSVVDALLNQFRDWYGGDVGAVTDAERDEAESLAREKYRSKAWTEEFE